MYVKVRVAAKAKKERIEQFSECVYGISVKEPSERNVANNRVCEIMAIQFSMKRSQVRIVKGHRHSSKLLEIMDDFDLNDK